MPIFPATSWSRLVVTRDAATNTYTAQSFIRQPLYEANDIIDDNIVTPITKAQADSLLAACVASMNVPDSLPASVYSRFELMCARGDYTVVMACQDNTAAITVTDPILITDESGPIPLSTAQTLLAAAWARSKAANGV